LRNIPHLRNLLDMKVRSTLDQMDSLVARIRAAGAASPAAFARDAGVPLTTLCPWLKDDFRPRIFETLEKLGAAAERAEARKATPAKRKRKTAA
jgi:hypothetical protein